MGGDGDRIVIVGGGIVGLAVAYQIAALRPRALITVLEKEKSVCSHQSGNNSGVLHAGLYYRPGSQKAQLAVSGIRAMTAFCETHGIAHEICGKLVVAIDEAERERLLGLHQRGIENGLKGLEWLGPEQMREVEPNVAGIAALRVPEEGIVDYPGVCRALTDEIGRMNGSVVTNATVQRLTREAGGWRVETTAGAFGASFLITCGGLHADRLMRLAGERCDVEVVPFRGEYFRLKADREHLVRNLIYPVPDPHFPFLGVHFTRLIHGGVEAGPNAVLAFAREGYTHWKVDLRDLVAALGFPGLRRFVMKHPAQTWAELRRSFSRPLFAAALRRLVPALRDDDLEPGGAGVRAQAMRADGSLVEDFEIAERERALFVLNAPSPAATASLAIGHEIARRAIHLMS